MKKVNGLMRLKNLGKVAALLERKSKKVTLRDPMVFGYIRISKTEREHKYSLEYQTHLIERCYQERFKDKYSWGGVFQDKVSSQTPFLDRTSGRAILNRLLPGDILIVYRLDRMSRSQYEGSDLMQLFDAYGVLIVTIDSALDLTTATGRLIANVMVTVAEMEREAIGKRSKEAVEYRRLVKRKGFVSRSPPPGWKLRRVNGEFLHLPCKAAQETAAWIVIKRDQEGLTWDRIGQMLRRRKVKHNKACVWEHRTVRVWYEACKAGFPNNSKFQRQNLPPLVVDVDEFGQPNAATV